MYRLICYNINDPDRLLFESEPFWTQQEGRLHLCSDMALPGEPVKRGQLPAEAVVLLDSDCHDQVVDGLLHRLVAQVGDLVFRTVPITPPTEADDLWYIQAITHGLGKEYADHRVGSQTGNSKINFHKLMGM